MAPSIGGSALASDSGEFGDPKPWYMITSGVRLVVDWGAANKTGMLATIAECSADSDASLAEVGRLSPAAP
jgi:hypothetical protein